MSRLLHMATNCFLFSNVTYCRSLATPDVDERKLTSIEVSVHWKELKSATFGNEDID